MYFEKSMSMSAFESFFPSLSFVELAIGVAAAAGLDCKSEAFYGSKTDDLLVASPSFSSYLCGVGGASTFTFCD